MISEKFFIKNYTSFWKSIFPLSNIFMRGVLMETSHKKDELELYTVGRRFSFVSQIGFMVFARSVQDSNFTIRLLDFENNIYHEIEQRCIDQFEIYKNEDEVVNTPLNLNEFRDAKKLAIRLENFFGHSKSTIKISPSFQGCGYLNNSFGDIMVDDTLYEIKAVNRNFNIQDFRQLMIYCVMNYISKKYYIKSIGLYNPRYNTYYKIDLESFCHAISGESFSELSWRLINFVTAEYVSK